MSTRPFDLTGPLPEHLLAIEASAGTGKTFTLSAIATRLIAEADVAASELLVVTFTRAATSELRSRVRQQLVDTAARLRVDDPHTDTLLAHLADTSPEQRSLRCERMERAVTEFDTATVTTIHGFATQVLGTLGVTAGTDLDATLVDDADELLGSVCSDVLAAAAVAVDPDATLPSLKALVDATKIAARIPDLDLVPAVDEPGTDPSQRLIADLVRRCVGTINRRRRHAGTLSFDDVLSELRDALRGSGAAAVIEALRHRFRAALIDEFQDTDPVQWDIFSTLFGSDEGTRLILVGDPKQAIYSFRGADIATYTDAVAPRPGLVRRSLTTNWRADGAVVGSLNTLFDGVTFGSGDIAYSDVTAAPEHEHLRVEGRDGSPLPSLAIRLALGSDLERTTTPKADPNLATDAVRRAIFGDLAMQVRQLLDGATLPTDDDLRRPVRPSDVAVLVRTAKDATKVQTALLAQGIPAVLAGGGSVLDSEAATQWRWLLDGIARPSDPTGARTFALSWFGGLDPLALDQLTDEATIDLQEQLRNLADTLAEKGVNPFIQLVWRTTGVSTRVLARAHGDRDLTDLDHIAELLIAAYPDGRAGVASLMAVLDGHSVAAADTETHNDVLARRVESDQQAVQIMTIWVAKGLEFPIVCCPTLWSEAGSDVLFHAPGTGRRTFDVTGGKDWPDKATADERKELARVERMYENLRLAYVALTRARHHTILWWSRTRDSSGTAAARLLFARTDGRIDHETFTGSKIALPADDAALDVLEPLVDAGGGTISTALHGRPPRQTRPWSPVERAASDTPLEIARLHRSLDRSACRWSFTAITNRSNTSTVESSTAGDADERIPGHGDLPRRGDLVDPVIAVDAPLTLDAVCAAPFAALPAGAEIGTLVHSVLERVDFAAVDLDDELQEVLDEELAWRFVDLRPDGIAGATASDGTALLHRGIRNVLDTSLGPAFGGVALRSLRRTDRIDEMHFEIRLGGDGSPATDRSIGALVAQHLPTDDPLRPWSDALAAGRFDVGLAGHMNGSIDLVAGVEAAGDTRFVVVDYKTNRLHRRGRLPAPDDYGRAVMARAMAEHHYPLQALLYSVALHRYLRWRLPGYDPATNLGGAAYLFLRGMAGGETPVHDGHPDGVFHWAIPSTLVVELSDLLDGRHAGRSRR